MERILVEGDQFYATALRSIRNARHSVYFDMYIFQSDEIGRLFRAALTRAAQKGLRVHVVFDAVGSGDTPDAFWKPLSAAGALVFAYLPFRRSRLFRPNAGRAGLWTWFKIYFLRRHHRKIIIIDDHLAMTGGFNVMRECSRKYYGPARWLDTMYLTDLEPVVRELSQIHLDSLRRARWPQIDLRSRTHKRVKEAILFSGSSVTPSAASLAWPARLLFRLLPPRPPGVHVMGIPRALKRRLRVARRRIYLCFPYFIPYGGFLRLLARRARQGVDVRVYLSALSDSPWIQEITLYQAKKLYREGVRVYLYHGREHEGDPYRFNHSKVVLIDGWAGTGSSNFDSRSFQLNLETFVLRRRPDFLGELERFFDYLERFSEPGTEKNLRTGLRARLLHPFRRFL